MTARERILAKLRSAPARNAAPRPDVAGYFARHTRQEDDVSRVHRFKTTIEAAHAEVLATDASAWPELVQSIARDKGIRKLLVGTGLPHVARMSACPSNTLSVMKYEQPVEDWRNEFFDNVDASLTLARGAIAETGSLILWPDANEPRLLSLVPPIHIVLLDPATISADLSSVMERENWKDGLPTNALLISGPSKTADIQQVLAYGAHGPKELIVLLCPSLGSAT